MGLTVTFASLAVWPHESTPDYMRKSRFAFKAGWGDTLEKLSYEIGRLDGTDVVIRTGHSDRDIRRDGMPRSDARQPGHPGVEISFMVPVVETPAIRRGKFLIGSEGGERAALRATHPDHGGNPDDFRAVQAAINAKPRRITFPCDLYERWEHNVRAIALTLDALRAVDRYGANQGRQYEGFAQLTTGTPTT